MNGVKDLGFAIDRQCHQTHRLPLVEGQNDSSNGSITQLQWHPGLPLVFVSFVTGSIRIRDAQNRFSHLTWTGHAVDVVNDEKVQFYG